VNVLGDLYLDQISSEQLLKAVVELQISQEKHINQSPATMNRIKSTFKSFFNWAYSTGRCSINPAIVLHMARTDSRRTVPISMGEIETLLETIPNFNDVHSLRDEALFSVYAFTGIRRSEALNLTTRDFDPKALTLFIANPKGGRSRLQPIPLRLVKVLSRHITENISGRRKTTLPLFSGIKSDNALSAKQAWIRFKKWKRLSGIRMNLTIHSFRAGYATMLYQATGDALMVARAIGHTDIKTTERYITNETSHLHTVLAKIFPIQNHFNDSSGVL